MKMSRFTTIVAVIAHVVLLTPASRAEIIIAHTSFEEPVVPIIESPNVPGFFIPTDEYNDPGNPAANHALVNINDGQNSPVNYTSIGGELGFSAFYTNTRNSEGLTDGDFAGVVRDYDSLTSQINNPTQGVQMYALSDLDGMVTVTLDSVDLTGYIDPKISLDAWVRSATYEADDFFAIWLEVNQSGNLSTITLLDSRPDDIDAIAPGIEGPWRQLSSPLPAGAVVTLKFAADTESPTEMVAVDNIRFTAVPEPASVFLLILGMVGAIAVRRRQKCRFSTTLRR